MNEYNVIETIYNEREQFIIIGLTGRTGAGCSTVSSILSEESFYKLNLHTPKSTDFNNNDERKYQIIYKYAEKHWQPFQRISMTDMIFSFIIQNNYDSFMAEMKEILDDVTVNEIEDKLLRENPSIKEEFNDLSSIMLSCLKSDSNSLSREGSNYKKELEILKQLPILQKQFRNVMKEQSFINKDNKVNSFTFCLQEFGNRIRHHGNIYKEKVFSSNCIFALARRANDFIKAIRHFNKIENKPTFICLDAIRNPYEATYFQDRYASFYLVSVSTDDDERKRRLSYSFDAQQIKAMDNTEYPKKLEGEKSFINQHIGACAQLADIYLYNPREDTSEKYFITELVVKYITLIKHPGLVTPSSVERCMQIASKQSSSYSITTRRRKCFPSNCKIWWRRNKRRKSVYICKFLCPMLKKSIPIRNKEYLLYRPIYGYCQFTYSVLRKVQIRMPPMPSVLRSNWKSIHLLIHTKNSNKG